MPLWCGREERRSPRRGEIPTGRREGTDKQKQEKNPRKAKNSDGVTALFLEMKTSLPWINGSRFQLSKVFSFLLNDEIPNFIFEKTEKILSIFIGQFSLWVYIYIMEFFSTLLTAVFVLSIFPQRRLQCRREAIDSCIAWVLGSEKYCHAKMVGCKKRVVLVLRSKNWHLLRAYHVPGTLYTGWGRWGSDHPPSQSESTWHRRALSPRKCGTAGGSEGLTKGTSFFSLSFFFFSPTSYYQDRSYRFVQVISRCLCCK